MNENNWTGKQLGKYQILNLLGHGGMGSVYKAVHTILDKTICIKLMSPDLASSDQDAVTRFISEAKVIAMLEHPNIVRFYDIEKEGGIYFIVMEYVDGKTLMQLLKERDAFSVRDTLNIGIQICEALKYAHGRGVIHRDIKPHNIMLAKDATAKLTDFGLARQQNVREKSTKDRTLIGTPLYMAPEYINSGQISALTDLYAFGVTLFQMLTGETPYKEDDTVALFAQHLESPIPSLLQYRSDIPKALEKTITKLMAKDPKMRFASASEVLESLTKCLSDLRAAQMRTTKRYTKPVSSKEPEDGANSVIQQDAENKANIENKPQDKHDIAGHPPDAVGKNEASHPEMSAKDTMETRKKGSPLAEAKTTSVSYKQRKEIKQDHKQTILMVDDDNIILTLMDVFLKLHGYSITTIKDVREAMAILQKNSFDLIISDINMPYIDGFQFFVWLVEKGIHSPFIFLTARKSKEDEMQALEMGVSDYITKPFRPEILLLRIEKIFKNKIKEDLTARF